MGVNLGRFTNRKLFTVLAGALILALLAFGAWYLWPGRDSASIVAKPMKSRVEPKSKDVAKKEPFAGDKEAVVVAAQDAPALPETPASGKEAVVAVSQPMPALFQKKPTPAKKTIVGKDHQKPNDLLMGMASALHFEASQKFMSQPGMGFSRMMPMITVMPRAWKVPEWTTEELAKEPPPLDAAQDLPLIHGLAVLQFSNSNMNDTRANPGSRPRNPNPEKDRDKKVQLWEIKSLDLIGLAMHDDPVVFVSDQIPNMKDLKKRPTRSMDLFESEGLEELMEGKLLYIRGKDDTIRVLGPINAGKACLKCHRDAKEGAMLGAFSYTLRVGQYQALGFGAGQLGTGYPNIIGSPGGFGGAPRLPPENKKGPVIIPPAKN